MRRREASFLVGLLTLAGCGGDSGVAKYNAAPAVSIIQPAAGGEYAAGDPITFVARVDDDGPVEELLLQWSSDRDGTLAEDDVPDPTGNVEFVTASLSPGVHAVTLTAVDGDAELGEASITVEVIELEGAPFIEVLAPLAGEVALAGQPYTFRALVDDNQDESEDLEFTVFSDQMGAICESFANGLGEAQCTAEPDEGNHLLSFEVLDTDGNSSSVSLYFSVLSELDVDDDEDGWTEAQGDCNDNNPTINPSASEVCDGLDNDCDKVVDEDTSCSDDDGDGLTEETGDCDDSAAHVYTGAPELEDGVDNDCDGTVDEGTDVYDDDGDGYSEDEGDCDDADAGVYTGADERCDFKDNDCDGTTDEENAIGCTSFYADGDNDGYGFGLAHCLCQADSTYKVGNDDDCYDLSASAHPAQSSFFTTDRGDGSFDYNCDGSEEQELTVSGECTVELLPDICDEDPAGWDGSPAACGVTADWIWDCHIDWSLSCEKDRISETQACR